MTAQELYDAIDRKYPGHAILSICHLKKELCKGNYGCNTPSKIGVLDFDEIKEQYAKQIGGRTPKSVDAICPAGRYFCFIEVKGWKQFLKYNPNATSKINNTANKYDLDIKFESSEKICASAAGSGFSFDNIPEAFILITDIDVDGVNNLAQNLNLLSMNSSDRHSSCISAAASALDKTIKIEHYYKKCSQLDATINMIAGF